MRTFLSSTKGMLAIGGVLVAVAVMLPLLNITLPGILPDPRQNSCFPKAARAAGIDYDTLILTVLDIALQRIGRRA